MNCGHTILLGGRYKLTGEIAPGSSCLPRDSSCPREAWDRWLNRYVSVKILPGSKTETELAKRRFVASAGVLARLDHPHVEPLLDYGATADGAPYHVMPARQGPDLATVLAAEGHLDWARVQPILRGLIAGVAALHHQQVVHGEVALHTITLADERVQLVDFADAELTEQAGPVDLAGDVHGVARVGFALLCGVDPGGRSPQALDTALAQTDAPPAVQAILRDVLVGEGAHALSELARVVSAGQARPRSRWISRVINSSAALAAATMLVVGTWSSLAPAPAAERGHPAAVVVELERLLDDAGSAGDASETHVLPAPVKPVEPQPRLAAASEPEPSVELARAPQRLHTGRIRTAVMAESHADPITLQTMRFDLHGDLPSALLVERGIDLTHGRPTAEDDPRSPIVGGPERARPLFQAACDRNFGKGCHMLGVQIAERMLDDEQGAGPAAHYERGCELGYHRSCAALADLALAGLVTADATLLEAKACLLAGPRSSYCR